MDCSCPAPNLSSIQSKISALKGGRLHRLFQRHQHLVRFHCIADIEGIGPRRRAILLRKFGSVKKLAATEEEIASTPGIPRPLAAKIKHALNPNKPAPPGE